MFLRINYFSRARVCVRGEKTVPLKSQSFTVLLALNLRSAYFMHTISKINSLSLFLFSVARMQLSRRDHDADVDESPGTPLIPHNFYHVITVIITSAGNGSYANKGRGAFLSATDTCEYSYARARARACVCTRDIEIRRNRILRGRARCTRSVLYFY